MKDYAKEELVDFVKSIKKKTNVGLDKHLCDHLLWMIEGNKWKNKLTKKDIDDFERVTNKSSVIQLTLFSNDLNHKIYNRLK